MILVTSHKCNGVSSHWELNYLFIILLRLTLMEISKLHITTLCKGNPLVTLRFPWKRARNAASVSMAWRHHGKGANQHLSFHFHNGVSHTVEMFFYIYTPMHFTAAYIWWNGVCMCCVGHKPSLPGKTNMKFIITFQYSESIYPVDEFLL